MRRRGVVEKYLINPRYPLSLRQWVAGARSGASTLLANQLGIKQQIVSDWRHSIGKPNPEQEKRMAEFFGVSQEEIQFALRDARRHTRELRLLGVDGVTDDPRRVEATLGSPLLAGPEIE